MSILLMILMILMIICALGAMVVYLGIGSLVAIVVTAVALFVSWLLFAMVAGWCVDTKKDHLKRKKIPTFIYNTSVDIVMFFCRVKIHVEGKELLPKDERFLIVGNHISNYDALVTTKAFRKYKIGCISKPANFDLPFFGRVIRGCCFYPIDRENPRNAVKTFNLTADVIKSGEASILVYPEGTRNKSAQGLLPFHTAVFKIAQKAGCPIAVIGVRNTQSVHKRAPFRRSHVYLKVLDVISAQEIAGVRTVEIGERVEKLLSDDEKAWQEKEKSA